MKLKRPAVGHETDRWGGRMRYDWISRVAKGSVVYCSWPQETDDVQCTEPGSFRSGVWHSMPERSKVPVDTAAEVESIVGVLRNVCGISTGIIFCLEQCRNSFYFFCIGGSSWT